MMDVSMVLNVQDESSSSKETEEDVTSKAVIKYKEFDLPVPYRQLKEDTNLNSLPENWLKSNLSGRFSDSAIRKRSPIDLSSFSMANSYLDHVGCVDVISDAENIKRLLKTPYSEKGLSMAVHRIRNTLLINELDIPKIISAANQDPDLTARLDWLKHLYCEVVGISQDSSFSKRKGSIEEEQTRSILSKFLHHSTINSPSIEALLADQSQHASVEQSSAGNIDAVEHNFENNQILTSFSPCPISDGEESAGIGPEPAFQRDVLWNLDDISMLVGSNMPIFGGGKFPVVSLRLRDATKPINILTGLDYWLDNLMCNVPELLMCFHLEGIVQKYEVVRTEDLPKLEDCKFSPKVVKDIAQDILSFLKSKCTKEGHTYWLFKGSKSDVVKLYDLTSICSENTVGNCLNPFTFPVASLLYKIAKNMIANGICCKKDAVAACSLLQNCISLLEKESHPELMLAANFLLAHLYMQDSFPDDGDESLNQSLDSDSFYDIYVEDSVDTADYSDYSKMLELRSLSISDSHPIDKGKAWLNSTKEEKCRATINFVIKALNSCNEMCSATQPRINALRFDVATSTETENKDDDEKEFAIALVPKQDKQIALESRFCTEYGLDFETGLRPTLNSNALIAYSSLAEISIGKKKYSRALKFIKIALLCLETIPVLERSAMLQRHHAKLGMMVGDICLIFAHKRSFSYEDFATLSEEDGHFVSLCSSIVTGEARKKEDETMRNAIDDIFKSSLEDLLLRAVSWYEDSLNVSPEDNTDHLNVHQVQAVTARLGNVRNELGVLYMNLASSRMQECGQPTNEEQQLWKKSYQSFEKGIEAFSVVKDKQNMALLYSNSARLMRLCAKVYGNSTRKTAEEQRGEFTDQERLYFSKAFEYYQKALSCLGTRSNIASLWDQISNDLSGAFFIMACNLQDNAPLSSLSFEEISKEVQNLMMKALHYCGDEENQPASPRYREVRNRMGRIHHRIASLYQHCLRNKLLDTGTKKLKSLSEMHYNKAYPCLDDDDSSAVEYISTLNEHVALHTQAEGPSTSAYTNVKRLKAALEILLKEKNIKILRAGAKVLEGINQDEGKYEKYEGVHFIENFDCSVEHLLKVLSLLKSMFSNVLKDLVMAFSKNPKVKVVDKLDLTESKRMYGIFLRTSMTQENKAESIKQSTDLFLVLADVIENIRAENTLES